MTTKQRLAHVHKLRRRSRLLAAKAALSHYDSRPAAALSLMIDARDCLQRATRHALGVAARQARAIAWVSASAGTAAQILRRRDGKVS